MFAICGILGQIDIVLDTGSPRHVGFLATTEVEQARGLCSNDVRSLGSSKAVEDGVTEWDAGKSILYVCCIQVWIGAIVGTIGSPHGAGNIGSCGDKTAHA